MGWPSDDERVAVLGGGVGGLTVAHELAERGFEVTVYEARDRLGGKARSMPVPSSARGGRRDLPAEHGFRFFPGFYRHLPDTMPRHRPEGAPVDAERVLDARRPSTRTELVPPPPPESLEDFAVLSPRLVLRRRPGSGSHRRRRWSSSSD